MRAYRAIISYHRSNKILHLVVDVVEVHTLLNSALFWAWPKPQKLRYFVYLMWMSDTLLTRALAALKVSRVLQHAELGAGACSDRPFVINHGYSGPGSVSSYSTNTNVPRREPWSWNAHTIYTNTHYNLLNVTFRDPMKETRLNILNHKPFRRMLHNL